MDLRLAEGAISVNLSALFTGIVDSSSLLLFSLTLLIFFPIIVSYTAKVAW